MSSEEMRVELEAFVNTGLREGWCGWPLKKQSRHNRVSGVLRTGPVTFWRRHGNAAIALGERLQAFQASGRYCVEN
jgi:hypothetical protein